VPQDRLAAARRMMRQRGCTHLLVTDAAGIEYLSGFSASRAVLLVTPRSNLLFTDFLYREAAARFCASGRRQAAWRAVPIDKSGFSFLAPFVPPGSAVGFQSDVLTVDEMKSLAKALRRVRFVSCADGIARISCSKTGAELSAMKEAARIGDAAFAELFRVLRAGTSEREAAAAFDRIALELGSEKNAFDTIVLFGARTSLPHGRPGSRKLVKGDLVLVDAGCTVRGLCSDMTRTVAFGAASPRQRRVHTVVRQAQAAALRAARAGLAAASLDRAARSVIEKAGFGAAFGHGLGHGVGRRVHERPRISSKSKEILQEGSIIAIEPGIYLSGFGGVRIEDMAVLSKKGCRLLTHAPRKLVELKTA
jgi:Xaa-Pro aminopeptidase